jgi:transcriptional regulator
VGRSARGYREHPEIDLYTPKFNQLTDRAILLEAMQRYSFAILFGGDGAEAATATHLPLIVKDEGEHGLIEGHFARANKHWQALAGRETLVVFPGPHSYVSPANYVEELSVPTWNYIAVHAYGTLSLVEDDPGKEALVDELIAIHEPRYAEQWRRMPQGYRKTMLAGIMGFRIPIERIEGKFKLSQNRKEQERANVRAAQAAGSSDERELAQWMERLGILAH